MGDSAMYELVDTATGAVIDRRPQMRGAARKAARIVAGLELVSGRFVRQVRMKGPSIDRLYDFRWKEDAYKYRVPCPGRNGKPCRNPEGAWMHPTSKASTSCNRCWTPTPEMREMVAKRNRQMNALLPPRSRT